MDAHGLRVQWAPSSLPERNATHKNTKRFTKVPRLAGFWQVNHQSNERPMPRAVPRKRPHGDSIANLCGINRRDQVSECIFSYKYVNFSYFLDMTFDFESEHVEIQKINEPQQLGIHLSTSKPCPSRPHTNRRFSASLLHGCSMPLVKESLPGLVNPGTSVFHWMCLNKCIVPAPGEGCLFEIFKYIIHKNHQ